MNRFEDLGFGHTQPDQFVTQLICPLSYTRLEL